MRTLPIIVPATVTELPLQLEPVSADPFIAGFAAGSVVAPGAHRHLAPATS
jgi:hypothetical protein